MAFHALLVPGYWLGADAVGLVQVGAAAAGILAAAALFWTVLPESASRATLAVALLLALPVSFDLHSYGNLSNVSARR